MKLELGKWGRGDIKGEGLFWTIEQALNDHNMRLGLSQQARLQLSVALPIVLEALGFEKVDGAWLKVDPKLGLDTRATNTLESLSLYLGEVSSRIAKVEQALGYKAAQLGPIEARLANLEANASSDMTGRVEELMARVAEIEKALSAKPARKPVKE